VRPACWIGSCAGLTGRISENFEHADRPGVTVTRKEVGELGTGIFCRFCSTELEQTFVDLGMSPLCESFLSAEQLNQMEPFYPLKAYVCGTCFLVQVGEYVSPESIFTEYAYFSSYSNSWLRHVEKYTHNMVARFGLSSKDRVVELGSNDGYLLQYFVRKGIPALGIDPARNVAKVAVEKGIPTITGFFGVELAQELVRKGTKADLLIGNNVLAQVPDINDFVEGMHLLLSPGGIITMEFPHLMRLIEGNQFDTIYHEHYSYFSFTTAERIFRKHGVALFDVEEQKSHGGSIRIYGQHADSGTRPVSNRVRELRERELGARYNCLETYASFGEKVVETKRNLLQLLIGLKAAGNTIVGYGAPGKANTLLNYCGIRNDFLDYIVDRNSYKHGRFTPGTHIEIFPPERISRDRPDYLFILPWNLKEEIVQQMSFIRDWGGRFIVPVPKPEIVSEF